ncbi:MAG TPA: glycosyltransferase family 2 protein [Longimicrobiaceae bacterium]
MSVDLSVVATLYRSAPYLEEFHRRVAAAAERAAPDFEVVLVNDGSPDESLEAAVALCGRDPRVRVVDLSRNFGHHKAMMTGLAHARGKRVFLIDSDLEEEPELLDGFLAEMGRTGADVVYGVQERRRGGLRERFTGWLFYSLFDLLTTHPIPRNLLTVRLMTRRYVEALLQHRDREIFLAGLWAITGFLQVPLVVRKLDKGSTTYTLRRKATILVNSVTAFSNRPLVIIFWLGMAISLAAGAAAAYMVVRRLFFGVLLAGWPSLIVSIWLLGGLTIFCVGILGIYLSRIFTEVKDRPYTVVRQVYGEPPA